MGDFGVLLYPPSGRCSAEPLHSGSVKYRCRSAIALTIALLGPWPGAPEKKKKKKEKKTFILSSLSIASDLF